MKRLAILAFGTFLLGSAVGLSGCSSSTTQPKQEDPGPLTIDDYVLGFAQTSYLFEAHGLRARGGAVRIVLTPQAGDLDLYLTAAPCSGYPLKDCQVLARSRRSGSTQEEVIFSAQPGQFMQAWVESYAQFEQSYTLLVHGADAERSLPTTGVPLAVTDLEWECTKPRMLFWECRLSAAERGALVNAVGHADAKVLNFTPAIWQMAQLPYWFTLTGLVKQGYGEIIASYGGRWTRYREAWLVLQ